ncbi:preprotein translocase subunit SecA, partial [bacterium]
HLDAMDHLRNSVSLRGFGQRDPLVEYKREGYTAFERLLANIQTNVCRFILKANIPQTENRHEQEEKKRRVLQYSGGEESDSVSTTIRNQAKIGRNDLCPCGSGKKFKRCCGG